MSALTSNLPRSSPLSLKTTFILPVLSSTASKSRKIFVEVSTNVFKLNRSVFEPSTEMKIEFRPVPSSEQLESYSTKETVEALAAVTRKSPLHGNHPYTEISLTRKYLPYTEITLTRKSPLHGNLSSFSLHGNLSSFSLHGNRYFFFVFTWKSFFFVVFTRKLSLYGNLSLQANVDTHEAKTYTLTDKVDFGL